MLALESGFDDRFPTAEDTAVVGMVEWETRRFHPLTQTRAWNLQQGCMLHWLPTAADRKIIYNDRDGDRFRIGRHGRVLGREARAATAGRRPHQRRPQGVLAQLRTHAPVPPRGRLRRRGRPQHRRAASDDDGLFLLDLETGASELLVSFAQAFELNPDADVRDRSMWFNPHHREHRRHAGVLARPATTRRGPRQGVRTSAFFVANLDGSGLACLTPYYHVSHHDWLDPERLLVWTDLVGEGEHFYLFNVETRESEVIAPDAITVDGHCSFARDGAWLLVDTYPDQQRLQTLQLWDRRQRRLTVLGRFYAPPYARGDVRCDLHPRWDRHDRWIAFDSVHEGSRQVYALDTSPAG